MRKVSKALATLTNVPTLMRSRRLASALSKVMDRQVMLQNIVDDTLLGGLVVRMGDRVIDASVVGYLDRLGDQLIDRSLR